MKRAIAVAVVAAGLAVQCAHRPASGVATPPAIPRADHHAHLISPAAAALQSDRPLAAVDLPPALAAVIEARAARWNDRSALAELFTADAMLLDPFGPTWIRGRSEIAEHLTSIFDEPFRVVPVGFVLDGVGGHVAGYMATGGPDAPDYFAHVLFSVTKEPDGVWRIAAEMPVYEGPFVREPVTAETLVKQLDEVGVERAAVLSVAYWLGRDRRSVPLAQEIAEVRAENDWVVSEVARFPDRLVAFCSVNPLRDYAVEELSRCATSPRVKGVKLHFGNSGVDVRDTAHVEKVRAVFRAANERGLAILLHLWTNAAYENEGGAHAEKVLAQLLPAAPDVPVQIAHMAGGGRSTGAALAVFAEAIAAGDPRTKNLYFDVATLTTGQSDEGLRRDVERMRQIGFDRILYGTDTVPPNPPVRRSWGTFRALMPLTDAEIRIIADNVAPYLR
ncbi:MAG TPA: amidohydrolase family protein [Thermoanaerobaculia bacterium]